MYLCMMGGGNLTVSISTYTVHVLLSNKSDSRNISYEIQWNFITCEFCFCKFACSLKFICNLQINTYGVLSWSSSDLGRAMKTLSQELTVFLKCERNPCLFSYFNQYMLRVATQTFGIQL